MSETITEYLHRCSKWIHAGLTYLKVNDLWTLDQRLRWLKDLEKLIVQNKDQILTTVAKEKNVSEFNVLLNEYAPVLLLIRYYRKNAIRILKDENCSRPFSFSFANKKVIKRKEPLGVVGIISPFNGPFNLPLGPLVAAILAGNGVILKPSQETPETNKLIADLITESLKDSRVIFVVLPSAKEFGKILVECSYVHKIHFTGSLEAGQKVCQANAAARFTSATLELGGSNAAIVLEDANLEETARIIVWSRFAGLNCNSIKRVFVVQELYEKLWCEILIQTENLRKHEKLSKLNSREKFNYRRFIADYKERVDEAKHFGPLFHASTLWESKPQILRVPKYDPKLLVLSEETFVPLLPIVPVKDVEEAVKFANDSRFGLGASIFTEDIEKFQALAKQLNCGGVFHNDALTEFAQPQIPFGGWKESGTGYTHGPEGLLGFTQNKFITQEKKLLGIFKAPKLHLYPWTEKKMKFISKWIDWIIKLS